MQLRDWMPFVWAVLLVAVIAVAVSLLPEHAGAGAGHCHTLCGFIR